MAYLANLLKDLEAELISAKSLPDARQLQTLELRGLTDHFPVGLQEACRRIQGILQGIATVQHSLEFVSKDELRDCDNELARFSIRHECFPVPAGREVQNLIFRCREAREAQIKQFEYEKERAAAKVKDAKQQLLEAEKWLDTVSRRLKAMLP